MHMDLFKMLYKSFQIISYKQTNTESKNFEVIHSADDDEYREYCDFCDKLCIERYKNHLKSGTHINDFYKRQRLNNCFP